MPVSISGDGGITGLELGAFEDVSGTPTDNQALTWDAATSQWVPETILDTVNAGIGSNVVQAVKTDTFTTSSSSYTDVTGLSVSITPTSASSKVLLIAHLSGSTGGNNNTFAFRFDGGNSNDYVGDAASSRTRSFGGVQMKDSLFEISRVNFPVTGVYLDSPATASAVTYKVQMLGSGGGVYLNRSNQDSDSNNFLRVASSLTAIEVAA